MKRITLWTMLLAAALTAPAAAMQSDLEKAYREIDPSAAYGYCQVLSSERFAGRLTGTPEYAEAARWAASKFSEWGLEGAFEGGKYLQEYPSPYVVVNEASMTLYAAPDKAGSDTLRQVKLEPGSDFLPQLYTDSQQAEAGLVFAGWGISAPELGYDDYDSIDVRGKYVVCFRGTPDSDNPGFEAHDVHRTRMATAKEKGALGLFYIYDKPLANPNGSLIEGFAPVIISDKVGDMILAEKGMTSSRLRSEMTESHRPYSFDLRSRVSYSVSAEYHPDGKGYNIACVVPGRSKKHKGECVVVGAHFDHCGRHMGMTFPGADDNGSGSSCVMEMARAFSLLEKAPERTVIFILFGGEEKGLEGSSWFVEHLPSWADSVDAMFNYDMTGEGDGTGCAYSGEPTGLMSWIEKADSKVGTLVQKSRIEHVGVRSSDFAPFFLKGATCASFYSNGPHIGYHKTEDTIYRINPGMLADVTRLGFLSAFLWADR